MIEKWSITEYRNFYWFGIGLLYGKGYLTHGALKKIEIKTGDAKLASLFVMWLCKGLFIPKENIFARVIMSPSQNREVCEKFWLATTMIDPKNLQKTCVDKSKSKGQKGHTARPMGQIRIFIKNKPAKISRSLLYKQIIDSIDRVQFTADFLKVIPTNKPNKPSK